MLSVRVKEFSFDLVMKVYRYPVSTRKFDGISVNHKRFGILIYFDGSKLITIQAYTPEKLPLVNGSLVRT